MPTLLSNFYLISTRHLSTMLCRMHKPVSKSVLARTVAKPIAPSRFMLRAVSEKETFAKPKAEEKEFEHDCPNPVVATKQVEAFLSTLVKDTAIAELHLQVGSFELKVRRNINGTASPAPSVMSAPAQMNYGLQTTAPVPPALASGDFSVLESIDESLMPVVSPKVGIFRRGKYAGGKRLGKGNLVSEADQLKKGQVLGFVEQLGTHFPVEAPQAGEIAHFLVEDGSPVEYNQIIVELAPFFGGHIIGESKHA